MIVSFFCVEVNLNRSQKEVDEWLTKAKQNWNALIKEIDEEQAKSDIQVHRAPFNDTD